MKIFIVLTFVFLFWGFYEVSGGADFEPPEQSPFAEGTPVTPEPTTVPSESVTASAESDIAVGSAPVILASNEQSDATDEAVVETPRVSAVLQPATEAATQAVVQAAAATLLGDIATPSGHSTPEAPSTPETAPLRSASLETAPEVVEPEPLPDMRRVNGNRVNMRNGPGTNYDVVTRLVRDDEVEVLRVENGWARLKGPGGRVGWMAERLLVVSNN